MRLARVHTLQQQQARCSSYSFNVCHVPRFSARARLLWLQPCNAAIGIDLGTTNSLVSIVLDGKPELVPDASGNVLLPSIVHYTAAGAQCGIACGVGNFALL